MIELSRMRLKPDRVNEELVAVLSGKASFEFKPLFTVVHANLRARNAANGGEEMLRLRVYEKLQYLVQGGQVSKTGKVYRGVATAILELASKMKTFREETANRLTASELARQSILAAQKLSDAASALGA